MLLVLEDLEGLDAANAREVGKQWNRLFGLVQLHLCVHSLPAPPTFHLAFPRLQTVSITNSIITCDPESGAAGLAACLEQLPYLTTLTYSAGRACTLAHALLPHIPHLKQLKHLDLSSNGIEELPQDFTAPSLSSLSLRHNRLRALPSSLCACSTLEVLDVQDNKLAALPEQARSLMSLTSLNCQANKLSSLPAGLSRLECLRSLSLAANRYAPKGRGHAGWHVNVCVYARRCACADVDLGLAAY